MKQLSYYRQIIRSQNILDKGLQISLMFCVHIKTPTI